MKIFRKLRSRFNPFEIYERCSAHLKRNIPVHKIVKSNVCKYGCFFGATAITFSVYRNYNCINSHKVFAKDIDHKELLEDKIKEAIDIIQQVKDESGCPGISITVTIDGKEIFSQGIGYSDLENRVPCTEKTVMRIASISKPITMAIAARLIDLKKLDIDKPVQEYVHEWPDKTFNGEKVDFTTRQLMCHTSGVRHYDKTCKKHKDLQAKRIQNRKSNLTKSNDQAGNDEVKITEVSSKSEIDSVVRIIESVSKQDKSKPVKKVAVDDTQHEEFYIKKHFKTVKESLDLFKYDDLCSKPGTEFLYTTYGWTLISAVLEGASGYKFSVLFQQLVKELDLKNTFLEDAESIIYHRSHYYMKNNKGWIVNAPYVDTSCKWAGGGMLSTSRDLAKFGNSMLKSYQNKMSTNCTGIRPDTMKMIWTPLKNTECAWDENARYALGWCSNETNSMISHTGGAVGASSVILILPSNSDSHLDKNPKGIVISIISNMTSVGLFKSALRIQELFKKIQV